MIYNQEDQLEQKEEGKGSSESSGKGLKAYAVLTALGFEIVIYVLIAVFLGQWLESKKNLNGLAVAGCIFIVTAFWIYRVISTLNSLDKDDTK